MSQDAVLEARDLRVSYGGVEALHGIQLRLRAGEMATVVGPNGAGKTTLLSAIMGLLPHRGEIALLGRSCAHLPTEALVASGLVLVPETRALFTGMSVEDNLELGYFQRWRAGERDLAATRDRVFALFPRLKERRSQMAGTLSGGERQMLALGRALMARPKVLMLDEPSLGLAPRIVHDILHAIAGLKSHGLSVLLVEQNARAALQVADYGYVLEMGAVTLEGPAQVLADHPRVIETYLGLTRTSAARPEAGR